jgi:hypothetical protein
MNGYLKRGFNNFIYICIVVDCNIGIAGCQLH